MRFYNDLTYGKQITYLDSQSDFPADSWKLPNDMPQMKKAIYGEGFMKGYDEGGKLIFEEPFEDTYWVDPEEFESLEQARNLIINAYFRP